MFFCGDDVGILHANGNRYGTVDKSKKIIKLIRHNEAVVVARESMIEIWTEGVCEKSCQLDQNAIDTYLYNNDIIIIQLNAVLIMNCNHLKIKQSIDGNFNNFIHFENGYIFLGGDSLQIISLGVSKNLEPVEALTECKQIFKSKQKKNAFNGVDELNYNCAFITSLTTFIATSKNTLHFFDMSHGQRPVKIISVGLISFNLCRAIFDSQMILSDVEGNVYVYDYVKCVQIRKFKDPETRSCAVDFDILKNEIFIAYLDRYVRSFNIETGKLLNKAFLKNKLTAVMTQPEHEADDENTDVWDDIPAKRRKIE